MISADLHSMAAMLYDYRNKGITFPPEAVDNLIASLIDLSQQAQALEANIIAPPNQAKAYDAAVEKQNRPALHIIDGGRL